MRVYPDICTLCRPFDDQKQPRIWLETQALCVILNLAEISQIQIVRSPIHLLENSKCPLEARRLWVGKCLDLASQSIQLSEQIKQRAQALEALGIKPMDALHAAAAESASCSYLLTCDDRFLKRYQGPIKILNPADFVVEYYQQLP